MAAYCREVRQLEDKFNGLELNHIPRRLNEAADTLAKMVSDREPVPIGIFASDQYKPSAAVAHPRTNGQVERANVIVLHGLKPRIFNQLNKFGGRWVAELPVVLWSLRMTPSQTIGYTSFFMVYGSKAILPTYLDYGAPRVRAYNEQGVEGSLEDAMDQLDEVHDVALLHSAKYQQALRRYHSRWVRGWAFNIGDLVLRLVQSNKNRHKLSPPWEGPYIVPEVLRPDTYKLKTINGKVFVNAWNIKQLRRFYP
ncbi:uncharacterized protein [Miscanthus floridulus]|uniref:uncharacterized protein n=1 Tax=Miscanthus floridulus TaxID=154761 RepID=UPI00345A72B5